MNGIVKLVLALTLIASPVLAQEGRPMNAEEMQEMQKRAEMARTPGKHHQELASLVGSWDIEVKFTMPGMEQSSNGTAEYEWVIEGLWVGLRIKAPVMGMPFESYSILGFDNTTKNHVSVTVSSFDTAMNMARGVVVDPTGKESALYGTLDEYTTGEFNKPYKAVTRMIDADHHVLEVWDLGIGADGMKVFEYHLSRKK